MASIFSEIIEGKIPSFKVAESENFYAFLDINPLAKGHTLVVPKNEVDYIFDLDHETYIGLLDFAKQVASALEKCVVCERIGLTVIGLEVPHAHIHLIPINAVNDMDFSKKRVELSQNEFAELAMNILSEFEALK